MSVEGAAASYLSKHGTIGSQHTVAGDNMFQRGLALLGRPGTEFLDTGGRYQTDSFGLPQQLLGENSFLRETIDCSVIECDDFVTSELLPVVLDKNPNIQWSVIRMNQQTVGRVPLEGVAPILTVSKDLRGVTSCRRGLAVRIERDFAATVEGHETFMMSMRGLTRAIASTVSYDGLEALMSRNRTDEQAGVAQAAAASCEQFAMFQKNPQALELMLATARAYMQRNGFKPTAMVLPPGAMSYLALNGTRAGYEQRAITPELRVPGCKLLESPLFPGPEGTDTSPLWRDTQVGEMYVAPNTGSGDINFEIHDGSSETNKTVKVSLTTEIINFETTQEYTDFKTWAEAHWDRLRDRYGCSDESWSNPHPWICEDASGRYSSPKLDKGGLFCYVGYLSHTNSVARAKCAEVSAGMKIRNIADVKDERLAVVTPTLLKWVERALRRVGKTIAANTFTLIDTVMEPLARGSYPMTVYAAEMLGRDGSIGLEVDMRIMAKYMVRFFDALADEVLDVEKVMKVVLVRPFMKYRMGSVLCVEAGGRAGNTFVGDNSFTVDEDAKSMCYYGNATFYSKAVVSEPRARYILDDVFAGGCVSGAGATEIRVMNDPVTQKLVLSGDYHAVIVAVDFKRSHVENMAHPALEIGKAQSGWEAGPYLYFKLCGWETLFGSEMYRGMLSTTLDSSNSAELITAWNSGHRDCARNVALFTGDCRIGETRLRGTSHWAGLSNEGSGMRSGRPRKFRRILPYVNE